MSKYKESDRNKEKIEGLMKIIDTECDVVVEGIRYKGIVRAGRSDIAWDMPVIVRIVEVGVDQEFKNFSKRLKCHYEKTFNIHKRPIQHASELYEFIRKFRLFIKDRRMGLPIDIEEAQV